MAEPRVQDSKPPRRRRPAATTPEERENQLINAAVDLAEEQLRDGTASAQVITHFLKLGSTREALEQERLRHENLLTQEKIESLRSAQRMEGLIADALNAMRGYKGEDEPDADD